MKKLLFALIAAALVFALTIISFADLVAPPSSIFLAWPFVIVALVLIAAAVVIFLLIARHRKKQSKTAVLLCRKPPEDN